MKFDSNTLGLFYD